MEKRGPSTKTGCLLAAWMCAQEGWKAAVAESKGSKPPRSKEGKNKVRTSRKVLSLPSEKGLMPANWSMVHGSVRSEANKSGA